MSPAWLSVAGLAELFLGARRDADRAERRAAELEAALATEKATHRTLLDAERAAATTRLAAFAHDLSSPLTSIISSLDLLQELEAEHEASIGDLGSNGAEQRALACEMRVTSELARAAGLQAATLVRNVRAQARDLAPAALEHALEA